MPPTRAITYGIVQAGVSEEDDGVEIIEVVQPLAHLIVALLQAVNPAWRSAAWARTHAHAHPYMETHELQAVRHGRDATGPHNACKAQRCRNSNTQLDPHAALVVREHVDAAAHACVTQPHNVLPRGFVTRRRDPLQTCAVAGQHHRDGTVHTQARTQQQRASQ